MEAGDADGAEGHFRQALAPDLAEALANLGLMREWAAAVAEAEGNQLVSYAPEMFTSLPKAPATTAA